MYGQAEQVMGGTGKVQDYMDNALMVVDIGATMHQVVKIMLSSGKDAVVVEDQGEVMGVVNDSDIARQIAQGIDLDKLVVREFMGVCMLTGTNPCIQIRQDDTVLDALRVMNTWAITRILVVDEKDLFVGTITALDAIKGWEEEVSKGP